MQPKKTSGQDPFVFTYCEDLRDVPQEALALEEKLHGTFAIDKQSDSGHIYYGLEGCGILRVSPDLTTQDIIKLPAEFDSVNFHSTQIGDFDGKRRLFLSANNNEMVVIATLDGEIDFTLPRPEFDEYRDAETLYKPTDTVLEGDKLFVTDGYGANYITDLNLSTRQWGGIFGGKTQDPEEHGRFGTAHGMNATPLGGHLAIADRAHSRFEIYTFDGSFTASHALPLGSRPCGIDFFTRGDQSYAVVGSLDDPEEGRPAPIYILDGTTYQVLSTIRPKEDLGIERADHIHNTIWYEHDGQGFLICQSWKPGYYFVLAAIQ